MFVNKYLPCRQANKFIFDSITHDTFSSNQKAVTRLIKGFGRHSNFQFMAIEQRRCGGTAKDCSVFDFVIFQIRIPRGRHFIVR